MAKTIASQRQGRALQLLFKALLLALFPLALLFGADQFNLTTLPFFSEPVAEIVLKYLPWLCWGWAALLGWQALGQWRRSGGNGPRATGAFVPAELLPLQSQGWKLDSTAVGGDGQIVATSPRGKVYCIVLKGDRGRIVSDGKGIFRQYDNTPQPFAADLIAQTKQRAAQVQQRLGTKKVLPVLAFTEAIVHLDHSFVAGVQVVGMVELRRSLLHLEQAQTSSSPASHGPASPSPASRSSARKGSAQKKSTPE